MQNQRGISSLMGIIIIVAVAVIAVGGISVYQYYSMPKEGIKNTTTETLKDETAGWKTYKNNEYGFEFKYPENFSTIIEGPNSAQKDLDEGKTISGTINPSYQTISFRNSSGRKKFEISVFHKIDKPLNKENYENFFYNSGLCDLRYLYAEPDINLLKINQNAVLEVNSVSKTPGLSRNCYYLRNEAENLLVFSLLAPESQSDFETTSKTVKDMLSTFKFTK